MTAGEPGDIGYEQRTPRYPGFSESDLVEKPAIDLFAELGWHTANFWGEFGSGTSPEGRQSKREAILRTGFAAPCENSTRTCPKPPSTKPIWN